MISYQYTITNRAGESIVINDHTTDPNNFIALQEYPVFDVDIKNADTDKEGQHGIWDFYSFFGKRVITMAGVIVGESEGDIEDLKRQIIRVLSLPANPNTANDGYVTVSWVDANADEWSIEAKLERSIRFDRPMKLNRRLSFQLNLKCSDPRIVSADEISVNGDRGYRAVEVRLPTLLPLVFGLDYYNSLTVNHDGTVGADTIIRLYGEPAGITNPTISNLTTGKFFRILTTIPDASSYIEIDTANGTVVDQAGTDLTAFLDNESEFILIEAGENVLLYESDENPYATLALPTADFNVRYRTSII
jgi:hypothetical protein